MNKFLNERGFILLSVIFLTLITSFMAMMLLNANLKVQQRNSNLRLTAIYLAEEQFAEIESLAASGTLNNGNHTFHGDTDDLKTDNYTKHSDEENSNRFEVHSTVHSVEGYEDLRQVTTIVEWSVDGNPYNVKLEKIVHIYKPKSTTQE